MKISEFFINGFGIFADKRVSGLSPGVNLFSGDNEAGKSTLLAFFRAILFGFETGHSKANQYKPLSGGEHGGVVTLELSTGSSYRVERRPGTANGRVSVTMPNRDVVGEEILPQLFPGVTKDLYRNVFAFSLDELQSVASLDGDAARSRIYSYGAGAGQVSALDVERRLSEQMEGLWKPRGQLQPINSKLRALEEARKQIRSLSTENGRYGELQSDLERVREEIATAEQEIDELQKTSRFLDILDRAWDDWTELERVRKELAGMPMVESFPEDGVQRLERCKERTEEITGKLDRARNDLESDRKRLQDFVVEMQLIEAKQAIRGLEQEQAHFQSAITDVSARKLEAESARRSLDDALRQIGDGWTEEQILAYDTSLAVRDEVRQWSDRLRSSEHAADQASSRSDDAVREHGDRRAELEQLAKQLEATPVPGDDISPIAQREEALRNARTASARTEQNEVRMEAVVQQKIGGERQRDMHRADLEQERGVSVKTIGILCCVGLAVAAVFVASNPTAMIAFIACAVLVAVGSVLVDRGRVVRVNRAQAGLKASGEVIADAESAIQKLAAEQESLASTLTDSGLILGRDVHCLEDLDSVEAQLALERDQISQRKALVARVNEKQTEVERALARAEELKEQAIRCRGTQSETGRDWTGWLDSRSLPTTLSPDASLDLLTCVDVARERILAVGTSEDRLRQITSYLDDYESRVAAVMNDCSRSKPERAMLGAAVLTLSEELDQSISNLKAREELEVAIQKKANEIVALEKEIEKSAEEWRKLFDNAGVVDEEQFRSRASIYQGRQQLSSQISQHEANLNLLAGPTRVDAIKDALANADRLSIQDDLEHAQENLQMAQAEQNGRIDQQGRLSQEIQSLETSDQLSLALQEQRSLVASLEQDVSRWAMLVICKEMMYQARVKYEHDKQPRVVQTASDFVGRITNGAYAGVFSPLGQQTVQLEDVNGRRKDVAVLSRGTREQVYLSLRFGLVREYSRNAEPLPVLMDDILVNFDPGRAKATAEAILELAQSNQVILFTCHPGTVQTFVDIGQPVQHFRVVSGDVVPAQ